MKDICTYCYFPIKRFFNGASIQLNSGNMRIFKEMILTITDLIFSNINILSIIDTILTIFYIKTTWYSLSCTITIIIFVKINLSLI